MTVNEIPKPPLAFGVVALRTIDTLKSYEMLNDSVAYEILNSLFINDKKEPDE